MERPSSSAPFAPPWTPVEVMPMSGPRVRLGSGSTVGAVTQSRETVGGRVR